MLDHRETKGQRGQMDRMAIRASPVLRARKAPRGHKGLLDRMGLPDLSGARVLAETRGLRASPAPLDRTARSAHRAWPAPLGPRA